MIYLSRIRSFLKKHWKKLAFAAIVIGLLFAWNNYRTKAAEEAALEKATVKRGTLTQTLVLSGEVQTEEAVTLNFQTGGKLASLAVKDGDIVQKGQYIASLDQRQVHKTLQKDLNTFLKARWDLDQTREDYEDTIIDDQIKRIIDKSQFDLNNTILDVEIQSIAKELSNISAPISGIITTTFRNKAGQNVTPATDIVEIVNPDSLYFALTADQTEVSSLNASMSGTLRLDAYLDEELTGTIERIAFTPKAGETSTVYEVIFKFTNSSNSQMKYRSGMTGDVEFVTQEKKNVLYIPFSHLTEKNNKHFVKVKENGKILDRPVKIGMEADSDVEIISGLREGEVIYD